MSLAAPRPNFVVLLGDRYGWQPVPYRIPADEMDSIFDVVDNSDETLLIKWYRLDENAMPPEYILQPRGEVYQEFQT